MAIYPLARGFLSRRAPAGRVARLLRPAVRYGRDQQHVLSAAGGGDVRVVAAPRAARVRLRSESEPLPHPHEEAEGPARSAAAALLPRRPAGARVRSGPLSVAAALAGERRAPRHVPEGAAARAPPRDR